MRQLNKILKEAKKNYTEILWKRFTTLYSWMIIRYLPRMKTNLKPFYPLVYSPANQ